MPSIEYYCTELENLGLWYELYFNGYEELLFEIQRRENENKRQDRWLKIIEAELNRMHEGKFLHSIPFFYLYLICICVEENQKRQNFADEHGRYLPQSMCPVISEPAVRYSLSGDFKASPLPKLQKEYKRE